ncbi:MAG: NAD(P)-dependent oxidoreductase [Alphaproteobacteria bacterium]|nr:NAD(P)-dependent oxidoreductase [Alphaproteobacteria bacterium]MDE2495643.1 NAD(P)-dependent oxidoreductase [Alphaproteobacteria bacterium]
MLGTLENSNMEKRDAVLFGGAGFIGCHLARALLSTGQFKRIICADLKPPVVALGDVEYLACDVRQPIMILGVGPSTEIYDLAAIHTTPGHEEWEYYWTNNNGALEISAFAERISASQIFFFSSISTYGPSENPRDERGPMQPVLSYGRSKLIAEKTYRAWLQCGEGRRLRVVRPAIVFGPGEHGNFTRLAKALRNKRFIFPGRSDTVKSCIYVGEVVRSVLFMRERPEQEITYNMAYPERYTSKRICEIFCEVAGYTTPTIVVPMWLMLFAGWCFERLAMFGVKTSINRARILKLVNSTNIVPKRALELGYEFETDLRSGLARWREDSRNGEFV